MSRSEHCFCSGPCRLLTDASDTDAAVPYAKTAASVLWVLLVFIIDKNARKNTARPQALCIYPKWHRHSPLGGLSASLRDGNRLRVRQSCLQTCLRDPNDNFIISRFSLFFNPVFQTAPAVFAGADDRRGKEKQGKASYVRGNADGILKNAGEPLHPASSSRTTRSPSGLPAA